MANEQTPGPHEGGPFLNAAFVCEMVLNEPDNMMSAIRIHDRVNIRAVGAAPGELPAMPLTKQVIVRMTSGTARGRYAMKMEIETPAGLIAGQPVELPVHFEGEDRSIAVMLSLTFVPQHEGLYWIKVSLDEAQLTKIPLRVVYQPIPGASPSFEIRPPS